MDNRSKEARSKNMSHIPSKNTKPEETVRKYLFSKGFRYRKNVAQLPGKPDIVLPKYRAAVFVNGKEFKRLPLNEPTDLIFDGVHIKVERGAISFCASDCEDKNCVKGGRIRQVGSTLACLQKNIVIQIFKND